MKLKPTTSSNCLSTFVVCSIQVFDAVVMTHMTELIAACIMSCLLWFVLICVTEC